MIHGGSPTQGCSAPHTITAPQPEEPPHRPQPPPTTATDPQSHVGAKHLQHKSLRETVSQPQGRQRGPTPPPPTPTPHSLEVLPFVLPGTQVGAIGPLHPCHFKSRLMSFCRWRQGLRCTEDHRGQAQLASPSDCLTISVFQPSRPGKES